MALDRVIELHNRIWMAMESKRVEVATLEFPTLDPDGMDPIEVDVGTHFRPVFEEINHPSNEVPEICTSDDLEEDIIHGDYAYHIMNIPTPVQKCTALYMCPSHPWVFPKQLIFYDPKWVSELSQDSKYVTVYPISEILYDIFRQRWDNSFDVPAIIRYLRNSDRKRFDTKQV